MVFRNCHMSPVVKWAILNAGVLLFFDTVIWWQVDDSFIGLLADFCTLILYAGSILWSLIYGIRRWRQKQYQAWLPLGIVLLTLAMIWLLPLQSLMMRYEFAVNYSKRMEIVRMVESGKLGSNVSYNTNLIRLPKQYEDLSCDGDIVVKRSGGQTTITFYTFLGILGHASGFMYKSDGSKPSANDFEEEYWEAEKLQQHWFWTGA